MHRSCLVRHRMQAYASRGISPPGLSSSFIQTWWRIDACIVSTGKSFLIETKHACVNQPRRCNDIRCRIYDTLQQCIWTVNIMMASNPRSAAPWWPNQAVAACLSSLITHEFPAEYHPCIYMHGHLFARQLWTCRLMHADYMCMYAYSVLLYYRAGQGTNLFARNRLTQFKMAKLSSSTSP